MEDYRAIEAANWSMLKGFMRSPAHVKAQIDNPRKPSDSMSFGTLAHTIMLEPEKLEGCIASPNFGPLRKTEGKATKEEGKANKGRKTEWGAEHSDKTIISSEDYAGMLGASRAIWADPEAAALMKAVSETEKTVTWKDEMTGVQCKSLFDMFADSGFVMDLKTAKDARWPIFRKQAENLGYFGQAVFYRRAAREAGLGDVNFIWIVVENTAPYAVQVFNLPQSAIDIYEPVIDSFLKKYKACTETDHWPAYGGGIQNLEISDYFNEILQGVL